MYKTVRLKNSIRVLIAFFILSLILSGATAIPLTRELRFITAHFDASIFLGSWLQKVSLALTNTNGSYPFLFYGYDWLAFGHFAIAVAFIGPLKDPVKNIWVIEFGIIACILIIPYAFVFSTVRGIPILWTFIDCSFGIFGIIPLWICRQKIKELERIIAIEKQNIIF